MADSSDGLRIGLLGPVEAWMDGREVALGGRRPRALLAALALGAGRVVATDRLIDELWGDELPERARATLQVNVSRLRKALEGAGSRLVARSGGYVLELEPGECDLDRWRQVLGLARRAKADGDAAAARAGLDEALAVWRGEPLAGVDGTEWLEAERARLQEERLAAVVEGIELDLELGRHGEVLGQLEALVSANPFMERLVELQMLALYRGGRQADALAAFHAARRRFVDELGIEPSERLRDVHDDVLSHAEGLSPQAPAPAGRGLPVPPNRTIGREGEIAAVAERLRGGARLVTLTGPGGVGKTRLALEAGRAVQADYADGAVFVRLAALRRPDEVPGAVVEALGGIVLAGESAEAAAGRFLAAKQLLLVVDNLEQVLGAAPFLGELLATCPAVAILATSREPLALGAETCRPVPPLAGDAATLFCERARAHDPGFDPGDGAAVAEICRRVDGLPLAIELAAARSALLTPAEIAARLETALGPGARDAPARQQSLTATIDWSHALLDADEQRCFARFAVFAGGATVEAAETVTGAGLDTLDGLVAKSLLVRRRGARTRLAMLETIRAYAAGRLDETADAEAVREAHLRHYLAVARRHGSERALGGAAAREHFAALDAELDNVHAALAWAVARGDAGAALGVAEAISGYWLLRNRYEDAIERIDAVLALPGTEAHPTPLAHVLRIQSRCLSRTGREAAGTLDRAEAISRRAGDALEISRTLQVRVLRHVDDETLAVADRIADEAIRWAEATGDPWEIARAVGAKAIAAQTLGELRARTAAATALLAETGDLLEHTRVLADASYSALCLGDDGVAAEFAERAAPLARARADRFSEMVIIGNLGLAALLTHDLDAAAQAFREELRLSRELVVRPQAFEGLRGLAAVAVADGDHERAARLVGAAEAQRFQQVPDPFTLRLNRTILGPARDRYGADAWDAAARAGGSLSFEAAIAFALGEPPVVAAG
jgi:predicted ATPase/DNA-binding SARP family transcriptional activator